jgi:NDP-sugar pyrophosphorylase family protein
MINAVILLNDDLDSVSECATYTSCKSAHANRSGGASNLFFLLSVSIPRPLFPIAGYPIIYHHIRSLSEVQQVQHVFLVGKYDEKKFSHFIDDLLTEFSFKTIKFIYDDIPKNEAGVLFKYRQQLLKDNPEYLMVMRYQVCSSFPLHEMIAFHKQREVEMGCSEDDERAEGNNRALLTVLTARIEGHGEGGSATGEKNFGMFALDEET